MLFRSWFINNEHVPSAVETNHGTLSKIVGFAWRKLADEDKQFWRDQAGKVLAEHKLTFPTYVYRPKRGNNSADANAGDAQDADGPSSGSPSKTKRKVREVPLRNDLRCEKIAELVADGLTGAELDSAMKDFDKHNVVRIVPRFEAPVTAGTFEAAAAAAAAAAKTAPRKRSSSIGSVQSQPARGFEHWPLSIPTNMESHLRKPFFFDQTPTNLDLNDFSFTKLSNAGYDIDYYGPPSPTPSTSHSCDPSLSILPSPVHTSFDFALEAGASTLNVDTMDMDVLAFFSGMRSGLPDGGCVDPQLLLGGGGGGYTAPAPVPMYIPASALSYTDLGYTDLGFTHQ